MSFDTFCSVAPSHGRLTDLPPVQRGGDDALDHVDRNGEADAHAAAGARIDHRIDADEPAVEIDQRAARIAGVDRGVGLDEEAVVADPIWVRASADTMPCVTVWPTPNGSPIAMTKSPTSSASESPISSTGKLSPPLMRSTARSVRGSRSTISAVELALVRQRDPHVRHVLDDVIVGHHQARRIDEDAGPERLLHPLALVPAAAEKPPEDRIVEQRIARHRLDPRGVDVDDRGRDLLDDRRERETHLRRALRRDLLDRVGEGGAGEKREDRRRARSGSNKTSRGDESGDDIGRGRRAGKRGERGPIRAFCAYRRLSAILAAGLLFLKGLRPCLASPIALAAGEPEALVAGPRQSCTRRPRVAGPCNFRRRINLIKPLRRHFRAARPCLQGGRGGRSGDSEARTRPLALRPNVSLNRRRRPVTRLRPSQSPSQAARQLPDQSTTLWVEPSSTGDAPRRGAGITLSTGRYELFVELAE